nr:hypothetical protein 24 [bacterium]
MTEENLKETANGLGKYLMSKDINRPIASLTYAELIGIVDIVLKCWQRSGGCNDEIESLPDDFFETQRSL